MKSLQLAVVFVLGFGGCASRSVREGTGALEALAERPPAAQRAGTLERVEVAGEDRLEVGDTGAIYLIPLVPFSRTGYVVPRAHEMEPEIERALWTAFRKAPGDPRYVVRCTLERSRVQETRTMYGLSIAGGLLAAIFGAPLKFMSAEVIAQFDLLPAGAARDAAPLATKRVQVEKKVRAGIAGLVYWYNTDVTPRELALEAWAAALEEAIAALTEPSASPAGGRSKPSPGPQ